MRGVIDGAYLGSGSSYGNDHVSGKTAPASKMRKMERITDAGWAIALVYFHFLD